MSQSYSPLSEFGTDTGGSVQFTAMIMGNEAINY